MASEFIDPTTYSSGKSVPFEFIIGNILLSAAQHHINNSPEAYKRCIRALLNMCWHIIKKNQGIKKNLEKIDAEFDELMKKARSKMESDQLEFEKAEQLQRELMVLHNVGSDTVVYVE